MDTPSGAAQAALLLSTIALRHSWRATDWSTVAVPNWSNDNAFDHQLMFNPAALDWEAQRPATATVHPPPSTLHPTPYTLHPTPYTLHPTVPVAVAGALYTRNPNL